MESLARALEARGWSAPVRIEPLGRARSHGTWMLHQPIGAPVIARVWLGASGFDALATEGAALTLAGQLEGIPVVDRYHQPSPRLLGRPIALYPALPGRSGTDCLQDEPARTAPVGRHLGEVMARLAADDRPCFAVQATPERGFQPHRATWADAWWSLVHRYWRSAVAGGTTAGHLGTRLRAWIQSGLSRLDTAERWVLVHRDLHPGNLLLDDANRLTGVLDWTSAIVGDPVVEWTQAVQFPVPLLRAVIEGYGTSAVRELFDDDALARLDLYCATRNLARLGLAGTPPYFGAGGRDRATLQAVAHAQLARGPTWPSQRMQQLLGDTAPRPVPLTPPPLPAARRRTLERLRLLPAPTGQTAICIAAALAALRLAERHRDASWLERADTLLDTTGPTFDAMAWEPFESAEERSAAPARRGPIAGALAWLASDAVARLGGAVDDSVLRGIHGVCRSESAWWEQSPSLAARDRLVHALLSLVHGEADDHSIIDAFDTLVPFPASTAGRPLPPWSSDDWQFKSAADLMLPVLRIVIEDHELPIDKTQLWEALTTA